MVSDGDHLDEPPEEQPLDREPEGVYRLPRPTCIACGDELNPAVDGPASSHGWVRVRGGVFFCVQCKPRCRDCHTASERPDGQPFEEGDNDRQWVCGDCKERAEQLSSAPPPNVDHELRERAKVDNGGPGFFVGYDCSACGREVDGTSDDDLCPSCRESAT